MEEMFEVKEEMLNMFVDTDAMLCDGDSEPFDKWDFSSLQPEVTEWDSN